MSSRSKTIPEIIPNKFAQPDAPLKASHIKTLQSNTENLWLNYSGNNRSFSWPAPSPNYYVAPYAVVNTLNTASSIRFNDSLQIPWYMKPGFDQLTIEVVLAVNKKNFNHSMRISTATLESGDAVSTTNGGYKRIVDFVDPPPGKWRAGGSPFYLGRATLKVIPDLGSTRTIAINLDVKVDDGASSAITGTWNLYPRIYSLFIRDTISE